MNRTEDTQYMYNNGNDVKPEYGMKWHKFLIWFILFFGAIFNIVDGIGRMQNAGIVGGEVFIGMYEIAHGAFQIFVRFQLSGFKKNAVNYFIASLVSGFVLGQLLSISMWGKPDVVGIASGILSITLNRVYYKKRKEMFIN